MGRRKWILAVLYLLLFAIADTKEERTLDTFQKGLESYPLDENVTTSFILVFKCGEQIYWPETEGVISWNGARLKKPSEKHIEPTHIEFNGRKPGISAQFAKKIETEGISVQDMVLYCNRGGTKALWNERTLSSNSNAQNAFSRLKIPSPNLKEPDQHPHGLQATDVAGCVLHHLIQPTEQTFAKAHSIAKSLENRDHICIQIRTGMLSWVRHWGRPDTEMLGKGAYRLAKNNLVVKNTTNHLNSDQKKNIQYIRYSVEDAAPFFSCAQEIESAYKLNNTLWYLTTDSESLRQDSIRTYGDKIALMDGSPIASGAIPNSGLSPSSLSVSQDGMRQELAEWWLLSRCQHLIISYSGFGLTAAPIAQHVYEAPTYLIRTQSDGKSCSRTKHLDLSVERAGL